MLAEASIADDKYVYRAKVVNEGSVNIVRVTAHKIVTVIPFVDKSLLNPFDVYEDSKVLVGEPKSAAKEMIQDVKDRVNPDD